MIVKLNYSSEENDTKKIKKTLEKILKSYNRTVKTPKPTFYAHHNTHYRRVKENGKVKYVADRPLYLRKRALTDANIKALDADHKKALERADHLEAARIAKMQRFRKYEYM